MWGWGGAGVVRVEGSDIEMISGYKTIREISNRGGAWQSCAIPSQEWADLHSNQKLYQTTPLINSFCLGGLRTYSWHCMYCPLSTPSLSNEPSLLSTLSSYETSHLSLSDSFPQMGTTPPYSPNGEITGRNRWDEAHSSVEIWTYSPQQTEKGRMTLCLCAEIFVKCVTVLHQIWL